MKRLKSKILLMLSFAAFSSANAQQSWQASPQRVAELSKNQTEFNYFEEKVPAYTLPDVLTTSANKKITNSQEWEKLRRPELLELFTTQVYGRVPDTPYKTTFNVVKTDENAMNGAATLKLIDIEVSANSKTLTIHLGLFIPNKAEKPVPAFLLICNRPATDNIDFTRTKKSEFWPAEEVIARGYAVAAFFNGDVDPDQDDNFQNGIHGLLDKKRNSESWGTIAAWAWGASRCLDYLVTDKAIDAKKVAVIGHSRGAKTALWAGATDQRFAMVCCNESGTGGSPLAHRQFGETIERINRAFPHWFCGNYRKYASHQDEMPFDMHELLALIAPRALYIASASDDLWGDPKGQYLSLFHSLSVFQLYNKKVSLSEAMPPLNTPVRSGQVAYHVREGIHNLTLQDWNFYMDQANLILKK
ncbi:MAG TPA: acetylxylan esterase [Prolixibacteraceae bacterium]|nr:acetylxylan esterase [Prolixibacteraceae bacterium]